MDWSVPKFEIGYWVRTRFVGEGYATEAVGGIGAFAFEHLGARRIEIRCDPHNRRSVRVAQRAGFRLEGELRNAEVGPDGEPRNVLVFSMSPGSTKLRKARALFTQHPNTQHPKNSISPKPAPFMAPVL